MDIRKLPDRLFLDLAIGLDSFEDICDNYNIPESELPSLDEDPLFRRRVRLAKQAVHDDGVAFKARCRTIVADAIATVESIIEDPEAPASVRLEAFKTLVKFGELEPKQDVKSVASMSPGLSLTIIAPNSEVKTAYTPSSALLTHQEAE